MKMRNKYGVVMFACKYSGVGWMRGGKKTFHCQYKAAVLQNIFNSSISSASELYQFLIFLCHRKFL